jgi:enolase
MARISSVNAIEILDSRGNPTLKVTVTTDTGSIGQACVPSGASTGEYVALELRDGDSKRYFGKGVLKAISSVNKTISKALVGQSVFAQRANDELMINLDGSPNKAFLGSNAILGVSLAMARAAAETIKTPLYRYLGGEDCRLLPCPMFNIINGGAHSDNALDFQEYMIRPVAATTFEEAIRWGSEIFHTLKGLLKEKGLTVAVGDEGGFAPRISDDEVALDFMLKAIEQAGLRPGKDVSLALDCAASEFYDAKRGIYFEKKKIAAGDLSGAKRSTDEQIAYLVQLCDRYPISSIEDPLDQNDWDGWKKITEKLGKKVQLVGDDLYVTNLKYLRKGIEQSAGNAILIKPNQVGTLSETLDAIEMAKRHNFHSIASHRSGETEDTFIADLCVALDCGQIKTGSLSRSDRVAKYNRLLEISAELGELAIYAGRNLF